MPNDQISNVRIVGRYELQYGLGRAKGVFATNVHPEQVPAVMERATALGWTHLYTVTES